MKRKDQVKEPIQIYMAPGERRFLDALALETGLSRAEILRRGMRSFAAERSGDSGPMQTFMQTMRAHRWPKGIAADHDTHLADAYTEAHEE
jgi:hypothetical protein